MMALFGAMFECSLAQNTKQQTKWREIMDDELSYRHPPDNNTHPWETVQDIYRELTEQDKMTCASLCPTLGDITEILVCSIEIFDPNKNGLIEKDETDSAKHEYLRFFEKPFAPVSTWMMELDTNDDGVVDLREMRENGPNYFSCTDFHMIDKYFCQRRQ